MFAQIEVSKTAEKIKVGKVQHIECYKVNDTYTIMYNDYKFTQVTEYKSFSLSEKDFNDLYAVIQKGFEEIPKEAIQVETPNDILFLKFTKVMGVGNLQITHFVNKNPEVAGLTKYLTKKATIKLFGKK